MKNFFHIFELVFYEFSREARCCDNEEFYSKEIKPLIQVGDKHLLINSAIVG
ncbi:MAG: hypothetical protein HQL71_14520 [Magnetococcales bacterium]|nr:hypothetical protein [Magnetococcales bacterium]